MRHITIPVKLNPVQLALLPVIAELVEANQNAPNKKHIKNINPYQISKILPFDKTTIKRNLFKFKELKKCL